MCWFLEAYFIGMCSSLKFKLFKPNKSLKSSFFRTHEVLFLILKSLKPLAWTHPYYFILMYSIRNHHAGHNSGHKKFILTRKVNQAEQKIVKIWACPTVFTMT